MYPTLSGVNRGRFARHGGARDNPAAPERGESMATNVEAEMVANVWKVLVTPGQQVSSGETLVILESMKMEIPVEAPVDGTVSTVNVEEGGVVQEGDVIAVIE
jgi:acetyl-CoA carboxylase biotin carboxyl carrier protein